jgi:hypothetical protein
VAEKISFQTNIIQELALAFPEGKEVQSQFSADGKQIMFSLVDGRVMFLNSNVAQRVQALNLQAREPFEIGRLEKVEGTRKRVEWHVAKVGFVPAEPAAVAVGVQASAPAPVNGFHQAPAAPVQQANGSTPHANGNGNGNGHHTNGNGNGNGHAPVESPYEHTGWSLFLTQQTNMLVDVYARCLQYASTQYGNQVKPEDVRALMTTAYINISKGGAR